MTTTQDKVARAIRDIIELLDEGENSKSIAQAALAAVAADQIERGVVEVPRNLMQWRNIPMEQAGGAKLREFTNDGLQHLPVETACAVFDAMISAQEKDNA